MLDVSDRPEGPYYLMPYMSKGSLATLLGPGKPLDAETILRIARGLAEGLAYAHDRGITHREEYPKVRNILRGREYPKNILRGRES